MFRTKILKLIEVVVKVMRDTCNRLRPVYQLFIIWSRTLSITCWSHVVHSGKFYLFVVAVMLVEVESYVESFDFYGFPQRSVYLV